MSAVTVHVGRRYGYRYVAGEDWERSSSRHDHGYEPNGRAVDNSVLDLTGARAAQ